MGIILLNTRLLCNHHQFLPLCNLRSLEQEKGEVVLSGTPWSLNKAYYLWWHRMCSIVQDGWLQNLQTVYGIQKKSIKYDMGGGDWVRQDTS